MYKESSPNPLKFASNFDDKSKAIVEIERKIKKNKFKSAEALLDKFYEEL